MDHNGGGGGGARKRKAKANNAGVRKRRAKESAAARKRKHGGGSEPDDGKAAVFAIAAVVGKVAEYVQQQEDYNGIPEESIAEMMRWLALDLDLAMPPGNIASAGTSPPPLAPATATGYVTVQGDMESCGPSYSGSASTVMASLDVRFVPPAAPVLQWPWPEAVPEEEEAVDDEWLAGLLTDGPEE